MTSHTHTRRKRGRQASTETESRSSKTGAFVNNPETPSGTRRVRFKPHQDVEPKHLTSVNNKFHTNTMLASPLLLSPTSTASTASSPCVKDAIWDSPLPSHLQDSQTPSGLVLTPSTPLTPVRRGTLLQAKSPEVCENDRSGQACSKIKDVQEEDYILKPRKLFRNMTNALHEITDRNRVPAQVPYNLKPEVGFAEACMHGTHFSPQNDHKTTKFKAANYESERPIKIESTDETRCNKTQRLNNRRSKHSIYKVLEHIAPISLHSRIAEDRNTCVASMVMDPNKRCTTRTLGPSIGEICRGISKCDLVGDSTKFLELITQLVQAVMCKRHQNSALYPTRHEKLEGWVSNLLSLSENVRNELQEWINAIVHGKAPMDAQHSTQQSCLENAQIAGTRSRKMPNKPVIVPKTTTTGTVGIVPTQTRLPWFRDYLSDRTRHSSIPEALYREIIKPLQNSVLNDGYIYVFWDKVSFGYVKIGYTNDLERRLKEWNKNCDHKHAYHPNVQRGELSQVAHVKRIERLVHIELRNYRKQRYCKRCKRNHIEWFEIGADSVMKVFRKWYEWVVQKPYELDAKSEKWILKPEMTETLPQVCEPVAFDDKTPNPTPRRSFGAKKDRKSKGRAKN